MSERSKDVFISYSAEDHSVAADLRVMLNDLLGDACWIRDIDLNAGDILVESISEAAAAAKFFVILMSRAASQSQYLRIEANFASFRAIQDLGVRIIVVRLDESPFPKHLEVALGSQFLVNLSPPAEIREGLFVVAEYINNNVAPPATSEVFVDRGEAADEFSLLSRRNKIIFLLGPPGIGKTSFVLTPVRANLQKRPINVKITRSSSGDIVCRQLIAATHGLQPRKEAGDDELLRAAVESVKRMEDKYFVFFDNAEEALDESNRPRQFVLDMLVAFLREDVRTHTILATTRNPEVPLEIVGVTDVLVLPILGQKFIREQIELLLASEDRVAEIVASPQFDAVVKLAAGFPLAGKLIGLLLKVRTPEQLTQTDEWHRFELKLAQHILRFTSDLVLSELQSLTLQVLAAVREPMSMRDLMAASVLARFGLAEMQDARLSLSNLFLIQQTGELMSLHPFLQAFYVDQLGQNPELRERVYSDIGIYAYGRAIELARVTTETINSGAHMAELLQISASAFRYAIPADRLLRVIGREDLATQLPIEIKGTLRELVFYFYQEKREYRKALEYADRWLEISPGDIEILVLKIRCLRNFRDRDSLLRAEHILNEIEARHLTSYYRSRLFRERALVKQYLGDRQAARELFNRGIGISPSYIENYIGLAQLILSEAAELPEYAERREVLAKRAVTLFEKARGQLNPVFDRYHLDLYVDALIEAGEGDRALPMLDNALRSRPNDARLNYRLAEVLRKDDQLDEASKYARLSISFGHPKASLSLANIEYARASELSHAGDARSAVVLLESALAAVRTFVPEYGTDREIADTITAKILRALGREPAAMELLAKYAATDNPYTVYEAARVQLALAVRNADREGQNSVIKAVELVRMRIDAFGKRNQMPKPLQNLKDSLDSGDESSYLEW